MIAEIAAAICRRGGNIDSDLIFSYSVWLVNEATPRISVPFARALRRCVRGSPARLWWRKPLQHERHGEHALLQSNAEAEEPAEGFGSAIALRACVRKERDDVAGEQYSRDAATGSQDNRISGCGKLTSNFIA